MDDVGGVVGDEDDTGVGVDEDEGVELCELDGVDVGVELLLCELVDDEEELFVLGYMDDVGGVVGDEEELLDDDVELCVVLKEEMKLFRLLQYSFAHACAKLQE